MTASKYDAMARFVETKPNQWTRYVRLKTPLIGCLIQTKFGRLDLDGKLATMMDNLDMLRSSPSIKLEPPDMDAFNNGKSSPLFTHNLGIEEGTNPSDREYVNVRRVQADNQRVL
jgi:hypothetical protein